MTTSHPFTDAPICPHCGNVEDNAWEINFGPGLDGDTEYICNDCGEEYFLQRHVSTSYSSQPITKR